jgi:hypothetical protein
MIGVPSVITQRVPKSTISDALRDQQHAGSPRPLVISQRPKEAIRMIVIKLATAGFLGTSAVSALAQVPTMDTAPAAQAGIYHGEHDSLLHSKKASNIVSADTNGGTAPTLPSSALSLDAPSRDYLRAARASLAAGHTGVPQQSLEMAEPRALGGSESSALAGVPRGNANVTQIRDPLHALGNGDRPRAIQIIDRVLSGWTPECLPVRDDGGAKNRQF